jgi:hypothetical protein
LKSLGAEVGSGEVQGLTIRQKRMLAPTVKVVPEKRKAVKSPGQAVSKKAKTQASPKTKTQGISKAPRKLNVKKLKLTDVTEEEKEQAEMEEALRLVEERKKKDALLKDTYDSGMDPKDFDEMHQKIPLVAKLDSSLHVYGNADGKTLNFLDNTQSFYDVFRKNHFNPMIKVKRVFDRIFQGVNSLEESNLSENQPISNLFASIIEPIVFPSESNITSLNAASSSGHAAIPEHDDGNDSERTPSPPPHQTKNDSIIRQETNNEES